MSARDDRLPGVRIPMRKLSEVDFTTALLPNTSCYRTHLQQYSYLYHLDRLGWVLEGSSVTRCRELPRWTTFADTLKRALRLHGGL